MHVCIALTVTYFKNIIGSESSQKWSDFTLHIN